VLLLIGGVPFVTLHAVSDIAIAAGCCFVLQGFGLGGVIATFGLVLDLIGFVLFLIFVLASSVILLRRGDAVPSGHVAVAA